MEPFKAKELPASSLPALGYSSANSYNAPTFIFPELPEEII
jgi:hypothetical protein